MELKMVRPFLFTALVILSLQACRAEPKILGESVRKYRVEGKLETKTSWQSLPTQLSHHMGSYQRLKVSGLKADRAEVTYTIKGKEKKSSYFIDEDSGILKDLNFEDIVDEILKAPLLQFTFYHQKKVVDKIHYKTTGKIK